jgi:putative membrane protein
MADLNLIEQILFGGAFGFGVFGISSIMSGAISQQWINSMKGINLKMKHSMLLSLISMIILILITISGSIVSAIFKTDILINSILFGCVLIFAFTIFVLWSTSKLGFVKSSFVSSFQPMIVLAMLIVTLFLGNVENILKFGIESLLIKIIVANIILLLAIYSFIKVIESPMRKNLGIGLLDFVSLFISHLNEGTDSLETIFEEIGEPIDTLVGILSFKTNDGIKALFLSPCVHPGPIGSIGGSNMPTILGNSFDNFTMVAHGPSTHDFNPVSTNELKKIEASVQKGLENLNYGNKASKFVRYSEKKAKIGIQFFNDNLLLLTTFAPSGSDDIEFSVGLSIMSQSKSHCNVKNSIVVDCHNSFNEEKGRVLPGNPELFQLLDTIDKIECLEQNAGIKVGCSENTAIEGLNKNHGIGDSGIKVMIIEVEDQRTAYILLDSNNMEIGFRERIFKEVEDLAIDEIEVMTTDTHSVNTLSNGYNPVGITKQGEIIEHIRKLINEAIDDMENVEAGVAVNRIEGLKTFGPNNSTELISTISSIVAVSRIMAPIIFILAILFVFIWIFYLPNI